MTAVADGTGGRSEVRAAARAEMEQILSRAHDPGEHDRLGADILALNARPFTAGQLAGYADAMRAASIDLAGLIGSEISARAVDTCGTGGDSASNVSTFNISTAAALLVSACGVPVAKHGNRAATSRCGSADVLEALGVALPASAAAAAERLRAHGFVFLFAPMFHPALAPLAPVRRRLGTRTVFNLMGPLVNPARPAFQVVGVSSRELLPVFAEALAMLGTRRALVVHSHDGMDEITLTGPTYAVEVNASATPDAGATVAVSGRVLLPEDFGFHAHSSLAAYAGGDARHNAALLRQLFSSPDNAPREHREVVIANAAAALLTAGSAASVAEGVEQASTALHSGAAARKLEELCEAS